MKHSNAMVVAVLSLSGACTDAGSYGPSASDSPHGSIQQASHGPVPNVLVKLVNNQGKGDQVNCDAQVRGMAPTAGTTYEATLTLTYPSTATVQKVGAVSLADPSHVDNTNGNFSVELVEAPPASGEYRVQAIYKRGTSERTAGAHHCDVTFTENTGGGPTSILSASGEVSHGATAPGNERPSSWHRQSGTHVFCQSRLNKADPGASYYVDVQAATDGGSGSLLNVELGAGIPSVGPLQLAGGELVIERSSVRVDARLDFFGQALGSPSTCAMTITEGGPDTPVALVSSSALEVSAGGDACGECLTTNCSGPLADKAAECTGTLCDAYDACVESTGCADVDVRTCYCGNVAFTTCFDVFASPTTPQGPCKAEIDALSGLPTQPPRRCRSGRCSSTRARRSVRRTSSYSARTTTARVSANRARRPARDILRPARGGAPH